MATVASGNGSPPNDGQPPKEFQNFVELATLRLNQLEDSIYSDRLRLASKPERDYEKTFSYKKNPDFRDFYNLYTRHDIAGKVVDLPVNATWSGALDIPSFKEWPGLNKRLDLLARFTEADRLAGLGRYSVLFMGLKADQGTTGEGYLSKPVETASLDDILFLRQYPEPAATVTELVSDASNPRFGQPQMYELDFAYQVERGDDATAKLRTSKVKVHASRMIHIASGRILNDVFGIPRLLRVFHRLLDLQKVVGGSAEMFWQGADRALVITAAEGVKGIRNTPEDQAQIKEKMTNLLHRLERVVVLNNGEANWAPSVQPDPRGIFEVCVALIAAGSGIPLRLLIGSERGELASTQDRNNFTDSVDARRSQFAWPQIVHQFLSRLAEWKAITPEQLDKMEPLWPVYEMLTLDEEAAIRSNNATALNTLNQISLSGSTLYRDEELRRVAGLPGELPEDNIDLTLDESDPDVIEAFQLRQNKLLKGSFGGKLLKLIGKG